MLPNMDPEVMKVAMEKMVRLIEVLEPNSVHRVLTRVLKAVFCVFAGADDAATGKSLCLLIFKSIGATNKAIESNTKVQMAAMQQQMASMPPGVLSCIMTAQVNLLECQVVSGFRRAGAAVAHIPKHANGSAAQDGRAGTSRTELLI